MKKFVLLSAILAMSIVSTYAQGYVRTVDGKNYWTETTIDKLKVLEDVGCEDAQKIIFRVPKADITVVEFLSEGLVYVQPDKINKTEAVCFQDDLGRFLGLDKKVYIPVSTSVIEQRFGSLTLRNLIESKGPWKVVGCPEEADFILRYFFDEKGKDEAYLVFSDRCGTNVLRSGKVGAKDWYKEDAGKESATKLYKKVILDIKKELTKRKKIMKARKDQKHVARYKYPD